MEWIFTPVHFPLYHVNMSSVKRDFCYCQLAYRKFTLSFRTDRKWYDMCTTRRRSNCDFKMWSTVKHSGGKAQCILRFKAALTEYIIMSQQTNNWIFSAIVLCPSPSFHLEDAFVHTYSDGAGCHERCGPAHQAQFGVHFDVQTRGIKPATFQ